MIGPPKSSRGQKISGFLWSIEYSIYISQQQPYAIVGLGYDVITTFFQGYRQTDITGEKHYIMNVG